MGWVGLQELWARSPAAVIVVGVVGVGALAWAVLSRDKKPDQDSLRAAPLSAD